MKYTLMGGKTAQTSSMYVRAVVLLTILAVGLLIYDVVQYGNLMTFVFTGVK